MSHGVVKEGVYYKHEKEADKLRMGGGAWSINLDELKGKDIQDIIFITETTQYKISMKDAHQFGFIRILGGETKLVVPINKWMYRRNND